VPTLPNVNSESYLQHLENEYQNLKTLVFQYDEAISGLLSRRIQSYEIDTGQNRTRVTQIDLPELQKLRDMTAARLSELAARLGKTRSTPQIRPGW
jgi:hypothetical protein